MGLDYSKGCVNLRDVGEFVNLLAGAELVPERRLLRGGKIDHVRSLEELGSPRTILNLRKGPDPRPFDAHYVHCPISNDHEKYDTSDRVVRRWLNDVVCALIDDATDLPVLVHCTSGKDRTGVVVATVLLALGVPVPVIIDEYLLSDGDVSRAAIEMTIRGIGDPSVYLDRVDLGRARARFGTG